MNMHILSDFLGRGSAMLDITSDETSNLSKAHETRDSLNSSYFQVVLIYFYPFWRNLLLKSTPHLQIAKETLKPLF